MKAYVIERDVPGIGGLSAEEQAGAAAKSCDALRALAPRVQWQHSYVTGDRTYCIYLAEDVAAIEEHARLSGFPANRITEVVTVMDPTTA